MRVLQDGPAIRIEAEVYTLVCASDRPYVNLLDTASNLLAELFYLSSVHALEGRDDTVSAAMWEVQEMPDHVALLLTAQSSLWKRKTYRFRCYPERLAYDIEVEGSGHLAEVLYFGGYYSGSLRWGSGFFWSGQHFQAGFTPEPNIPEQFAFHPSGGSAIDLIGVPTPGKTGWFFTPPPFCFAFQTGSAWLGLGVEATPGANQYADYQYRGGLDCFHLLLNYDGYTAVDGVYALPSIGIDFATDAYDALARHASSLRAQGYAPDRTPDDSPDWWRTPIYCGWGSQCHVASVEKGRAPDYARQDLYEGFLKALEENGLSPGIVVLDDKWQATYGGNTVDTRKWPDLAGFIAAQHRAGRKVLLWLKAWDPEGLPLEECVTNAAGLPVAFDPTNPAFERRFRDAIRNMLSPEGYDADGFKIDFTARIPAGPGLKLHGGIWGLELMKCYLFIIHDEAKRVKPDALVMSHTPNSYLADVLDMIRLNDINMGSDVNRAMAHRSRVAASALPNTIIDTDNWPITNKAVWREYVRLQPQLGVPSLYYATHIDSTGEPLTPDDYALIRETWALSAARQKE
jgi:hypothetical protein